MARTSNKKRPTPSWASRGQRSLSLDSQAGGVKDLGSHDIGVHVTCRPAILEIAAFVLLSVTRDPDGRASVCNPIRECGDWRRLVGAGETPLVTLAVHLDVLFVLRLQFLDGSDDLVAH